MPLPGSKASLMLGSPSAHRDDAAPTGLRTFPAGNYLIIYRQTDDGAEIARVIRGARRWQELL
ncbi:MULTISPECIES: type II toxin-antitoxin system RelE/ParE family toxin [unclassified Mesorhizobium]|uniref:type II toxin-antitoxin system RelE/ParE family toxin n=2 Tax=Mesorhizobium TaxID=68287 RepID=UPI00296213CC|nr:MULTISPECIES: type II toxin-antitoxin system RelE/ParE family toxin [unclassified Mesorhizobium]